MSAPDGWSPPHWDAEADVVIVGFGGAGAATAITAHDLGAKVLMLEKAPEGEEPWPCIFFVDKLTEINIPIKLVSMIISLKIILILI